MKKYHYTVGMYISSIIESGEIRLATAFTFKKREYAVWTSTNPVWENTCNKQILSRSFSNSEISYRDYFRMLESGLAISLDMAGTHKLCGGLCRIEVEPKTTPFTIGSYRRFAKMKKSHARALIQAGINMGGNPNEWFAGFKSIPSKNWIAIEMFDWDSQIWMPYEEGNIPSGIDVDNTLTRGKIEENEDVEAQLQGMLEGIYEPEDVFEKIME